MRILHVGVFTGNPVDGDAIMQKGFIQNGHGVTSFNYRKEAQQSSTQEMNARLEKVGSEHDVVFIGKGEIIDPNVLGRLKKRGVRIALWYGDQRANVQSWVLQLARNTDLFLHTTSGTRLQEYKDAGIPRCCYFIVPTDPDLFKRHEIDDSLKENIFFSGSVYDFAESERTEVVSYLRTRKDAYLPGITSSRILGQPYVDVINRCKIAISINGFNKFEKYNSERLLNYLSCGAFVLAYRVPGTEQLYKDKEEIIFFDKISDLDVLIGYWLMKTDERIRIGKNAERRAHRSYNTKLITSEILHILEGHSPRLEWMDFL